MTIAFSFLAFAGLGLILKNNVGASTIITLLITLATTFFLVDQITPVDSQGAFIGLIGIYLTLNFILGAFLAKPWLKYIVPILLLSIFYFFGNTEWLFGPYSLDFTQPKVLLLPLIGIIILAFIEVKKFAVQKMFPEIEMETLESVVVIILIYVLTNFATFVGCWIIVFFLSIGVFAFNAFAEKNRNYISLSLLAFALMGAFIQKYQIESLDLSIGKTIAGLLMGAGAMGMLILAQKVNKWIWTIVFALLGAIVLALILVLNNVHPAFGGIEAFVASFAGIAIIGLWSRNAYGLTFLIPAACVIGLTLYNDPFKELKQETIDTVVNVEPEVKSESEVQAEEKTTEAELAPIIEEKENALEGDFSIDNSSLITFKLGPKGGITKGKITKMQGKVSLKPQIEKSTFKVEMDVKNLSTFNEMRDESLMEEDYFNQAVYPKMSFTSNKLELKNDGYLLKGNFKMLSKTVPQDVFLKYIGEKGGKKHFTGKSSLNRTDFGMPSSPQEGDVVDFEIELYLK